MAITKTQSTGQRASGTGTVSAPSTWAATTTGTTLTALLTSVSASSAFSYPSGWTPRVAVQDTGGNLRCELITYQGNPGSIPYTSINFTSGSGTVNGEFAEWSSSVGTVSLNTATLNTKSVLAGATSFPITALAANSAGELGMAMFAQQVSPAQTGAGWTTPTGWNNLASQGSTILPCDFIYQLALAAGTLSVTGLWSGTTTGAVAWAAIIATFSEVSATVALTDAGIGAGALLIPLGTPMPDSAAGSDSFSITGPSIPVSDQGTGSDGLAVLPNVSLVQKTGQVSGTGGQLPGVFSKPTKPGTTLTCELTMDAGTSTFIAPPGWQWVTSAANGSLARTAIYKYVNNPGNITTVVFANSTNTGNMIGNFSEWQSNVAGMIVDTDTTGTVTAVPSGSKTAGSFGDNLNSSRIYGGTTESQTVSNWQTITGIQATAVRYYFTGQPSGTINADLQWLAQNNIAVALSFKPSYNPTSATDRTNLANYLASCVAAGLVAEVTLWHEPYTEGLTLAQFQSVVTFYGPTVKTYYPYHYNAAIGSGGASAANFNDYYNGAKTAFGSNPFDTAGGDYYAQAYTNSGVLLDPYVTSIDADNLPFSLWEFGTAEAGSFALTQAQSTTWYNYINSWFANRIAAGKGVGLFTHFSNNVSTALSYPALSAGDFQIPLLQKLNNTITTPGTGGTAANTLTVTEKNASLGGDTVIAAFGVAFSAVQAGNSWTIPAGWSNLGALANGTYPLAFNSFYQNDVTPGTVSATGQFSTPAGITGWAGVIASLKLVAAPTPVQQVLPESGVAGDETLSVTVGVVQQIPDAGSGSDTLGYTVGSAPVALGTEPGAGTDGIQVVQPTVLVPVPYAPSASPAIIRSQMPVMHAQNILTGAWISRDIQGISQPSITWMLNGADTFTCTLNRASRDDRQGNDELIGGDGQPLLQEWQTAIYLEEMGEIKYGGLVLSGNFTGPQWALSCLGFAGYPNGMIYEGPPYSQTRIDALDVVRYIWSYLQSFPNGSLNLELGNDKAGVLLGAVTQPGVSTVLIKSVGEKESILAVEKSSSFSNGMKIAIGQGGSQDVKLVASTGIHQITVKSGLQHYHPAGTPVTQVVAPTPYTLNWWDSKDCGSEIGQIQQEAPFDYRERHVWANPAKTGVRHFLDFGVPRLGARRDRLRFVEGENIVTDASMSRDGTGYANVMIALGAGQGSKTLRQTAAVVDGRLRRTQVFTDQTARRDDRLRTIAFRQLAARLGLDAVTSITVKDHDNARWGTFGPGDDIFVQLAGDQWRSGGIWSRILQMTQDPSTSLMTLTLARSDSFTYTPVSGATGTL